MSREKTLIKAGEDFIVHLEMERNLSPRTIQSYRSDLKGFFTFLSEGDNTGNTNMRWIIKPPLPTMRCIR